MAEWWESAPVAPEAQEQEDWYSSAPLADGALGAVGQQQGIGFLGTAGDILASGASGIARGTAGLVGLPGTVGDLAQSGLQGLLSGGYRLATGEWADPYSDSGVERFFAGPTQEVQSAMIGGGSNPLSAQNIQAGMATLTGGATEYQPQTTAGEYARTVGEFLPGGVALRGPQTIGQALTYGVAAPALTSEAAGQITEGTAFEPFARVAGALVGGYAGSRFGAPERAATPTAREIRQSAGYGDDLTEALRNAKTTKSTYQGIVSDLWDDVKQAGTSYDVQQNFGRTFQNELKLVQQEGASLHSLERLRRAIRSAGGGTLDTPNQAIAERLINRLDDAVENLSASNIAATGATGKPALDVLKEARQTYRIGKKAQLIEDAVERAKTQASGVENGLRIQFRRILNNPKLKRNFNKQEIEAIERVANGDFSTNAMRWLGTFGFPIDQGRSALGSFLGGGAGAAIGSSIAGPAGAFVGGPALMAVGTAARMGADASTRRAAEIADLLVKSGPQGQSILAAQQAAQQSATREAVIRALLQSQQAGQTP